MPAFKKFSLIVVSVIILIVCFFVGARTVNAAFSCDSNDGTTCIVSSTKTMNNGDTVTTSTISGATNLVIGATINTVTSTDIVYFNLPGVSIIVGTTTAGAINANFQSTSTNFTINSNGSVNVNGKGCSGDISNGSGGYGDSTGVCTQSTSNGGGASVYNGAGGGGAHYGMGGNSGNGTLGGSSYDSLNQPAYLGSGGGSNRYAGGGNGGGFVKIISNNITLAGPITTEGSAGYTGLSGAGGGGSGGAIWISASSTLTLNSGVSITADGGSGGGSGSSTGGGGGGGGIVALYYGSLAGASSTYVPTVYGGAGGAGSSAGASGGAGALFTKNITTQSYGKLSINNGTTINPAATIISATTTLDDLDILNNANVTIGSGITVSSTQINSATSSFTLVSSGLNLTINGVLNMPSAATNISLTGGTLNLNGVLNMPSAATTSLTGGTLNLNSGTFTIFNTSLTIDTAINFGGGTLSLPNLTNLTIDSALTASVSGSNINFNTIAPNLSNFTLTSNGSVNVNGGGCSGGGSNAVGYGDSTGVCIQSTSNGGGGGVGTLAGGGGGAHYGMGGGGTGAIGGSTYDSPTQPVYMGSGGGGNKYAGGGNGGGFVKIISNNITLAGPITAEGSVGNIGSTGGSGGGSGGAIWISASSTLTLNSGVSITADGGAGVNNSGGGGGGIVALYYGSLAGASSTYIPTVYGGNGVGGGGSGGAGGLYMKNTTTGALTKFWTANNSANWSATSSWSDTIVPTSIDNVIFNNQGVGSSTIDSGFGGTVGSVTINSGYTGVITLGKNLIVGSTIGLNAGTFNVGSYNLTLQGSGTPISINGGTFNPQTGAVIFSTTTAQTIPAITFNNLTINNTSASGTILGGNITTANLTINSGAKLDASANNYNLTVNGNWTNNGTFAAQADTVTFNASSAQVTVSTSTFNNLVINTVLGTTTLSGNLIIAGNLTINSSSTLDASSSNLTVSGNWADSGTFYPRSGTVTFNGSITQTIATDTFNNVIIGNSSATGTILNGNITATGNLNINSGSNFSLNGNKLLNIAGNFTNNGTFTAASGTVNFNNTAVNGAQTISGTNTFYNLTDNSVATATLQFPAGVTTTITNSLNLNGTSTGLLLLRSSSNGTQWGINAQGSQTESYLDVKDSNNVGASIINCFSWCTNSGNNTNWKFGQAGQFNSGYGINGILVSQIATSTDPNWAQVKIQYQVEDVPYAPAGGQITPSFSYSTTSGATWVSIASSSLGSSDLVTSSVSTSSWSNFSATWNAPHDLPNYATSVLIQVTINDADNLTWSSVNATSSFNLVTTPPTGGNITFDAGMAGVSNNATVTITPAIAALSGVALQYQLSDASSSVSPTSTAWTSISTTTTVPWTFDSNINAKSLNIRFRDIYGNTEATATISTIAPSATSSFFAQDISKQSTSDWKEYISWGISTSTNFTSYNLEYATSTDNVNYSSYVSINDPSLNSSSTNYYVHSNLHGAAPTASGGWFYKYRISVKSINGNITVRTIYPPTGNAYIVTKPDGVQDYDEGGTTGGNGTGSGNGITAPTAQVGAPTQSVATGSISAPYTLTDTLYNNKTSPSYEGYIFYNTGVTVASAASGTITSLAVSDASKMPASGYIQVGNEVDAYASISGNTLNGLTRGTWPTASTTRATPKNSIILQGAPVWIKATSTNTGGAQPYQIATTSALTTSNGQSGTITWNTNYETTLAGNSFSNVGIRVLVHDNQSTSVGPVSSQSAQSTDGTLNTLDMTAPAISFASAASSTSESSSFNVLAISLNKPYPLAVSAVLATSGVATYGTNYTLPTTTVSIPALSTSTNFTINLLNDNLPGPATTTAVLTLTGLSNATLGTTTSLTYTINEASNNPTVSFANATGSISEPISTATATATIVINLSAISAQSVIINYSATSSNNISSPTQYTISPTSSVTIPSGSSTASIILTVNREAIIEGNGTTTITINSVTGAATSTQSTYNETIVDTTNASPQFATSGIIAYQDATSTDSNFSKVIINYSARDIDAATDPVPYQLTPTFAYNNGGSWQTITASALTSSSSTTTSTITLHNSGSNAPFESFTTIWNPASSSAGFSSTSTQIQITLNDGAVFNATTTSSSAPFALNAQTPSVSFVVDASNNIVKLSVNNEISNFQYKISNNSDLSADGANTSSTGSIASGVWYNATATPSFAATSSWNFNFSSSTTPQVYFAVSDVLGNSTSGSATIPPQPTHFGYRDTSIPQLGTYQELLFWDTYAATGTAPTFKQYELWRATSTSGSSSTLVYSSSSVFTNISSTNFTDTNLSSSTTYYYKLRSVDPNGDASQYSQALSDIPDGNGDGTDFTTPALSNVVAAANTNWASISWTANKISNSMVEYALSSSSAFTASTTLSTMIIASSTHTIVLNNLLSGATYKYRAHSFDISGNDGYSGTQTFTTLAGPIISSAACSASTDRTITLIWNTNIDASSWVEYSSSSAFAPYYGTAPTSLTGVTSTSVYQQKITLTGLTPSTAYYIRVNSLANTITSTNNNGGNYYQCFTTQDLSAPVISNIQALALGSNFAVVSWQTDKLSTSQVSFGINSTSSISGYSTSTIADVNLTTNHAQLLTGLNQSTQYYYRVQSRDAQYNNSVSAEQNFTTTANQQIITIYAAGSGGTTPTPPAPQADTTPPAITNIQIASTTAFDTTINFTTSKPALAVVLYKRSTDSNYTGAAAGSDFMSGQSITLNGLQMGTDYIYKIKATDKNGNFGYSDENKFKTKYFSEMVANLKKVENLQQFQDEIEQSIESIAPSIIPPFIETPRVVNVTDSSATIAWKTNIQSYGTIDYGPDSTYNAGADKPYDSESANTKEKVKNHIFALTNLAPNTKYHFMVRSFSLPQVESKSDDLTFITGASKVVARVANIENAALRIVWTTDALASSIVEYKNLKTGEIQRKIDDTLQKDHDVRIEGLTPDTEYSVKAIGYTNNGILVEAENTITVRTSRDVTPPVISNLRVDGALVPGRNDLAQLIISWKTDKLANSFVDYDSNTEAATNLAEEVKDIANYTEDHTIILPKMKPGALYRIRVGSIDIAGNKAFSAIRTIITPSQNQSIFDVVVKNFEETFNFLNKLH